MRIVYHMAMLGAFVRALVRAPARRVARSATHLDHARTYVTLDLVRRAATEYGGSRVDFAMGVTDVDDKIINRAKELGLEPLELARREEANFFEDLDRLGCLRPDRVLRVSEHVDDIVAYVGDIVDW